MYFSRILICLNELTIPLLKDVNMLFKNVARANIFKVIQGIKILKLKT